MPCGQNAQTWQAWDGTADIKATIANVITMVECDGSYKALKGEQIIVIFTLKTISKEINNSIFNNEVPIQYHKKETIVSQNPIVSFVCVSGEERKKYEKLTDVEKEDFVSSSAYISIPIIHVDNLYEMYHVGISCDYEETINMIKKAVSVNKDNEKILFAIFVILHEFGHWHDFESKGKKPYLYLKDSKEQKEVFDLKEKILNDISLAMMSEYKIKDRLRKWFKRYNLVNCEKKANEFAMSKVKEVYNYFRDKGVVI